jgi:hypothetical protein
LRPGSVAQDKPFVEQQLDLQAGPALRRVHDGDIQPTFDQPLHQVGFEADFGTHGDIGRIVQQQRKPLRQELLPQSETSADRERRPIAFRDADIVAGLLDRPDKRGSVLLEVPARSRESRPAFVADEERAAQRVFQRVDPRTHRRLRHMKPIRSAHEIARRHHRQESPRQFGVQSLFPSIKSTSSILSADFLRFSILSQVLRMMPSG